MWTAIASYLINFPSGDRHIWDWNQQGQYGEIGKWNVELSHHWYVWSMRGQLLHYAYLVFFDIAKLFFNVFVVAISVWSATEVTDLYWQSGVQPSCQVELWFVAFFVKVFSHRCRYIITIFRSHASGYRNWLEMMMVQWPPS